MTGPVVCVGGPPGSGKSTAGRRVAEQLHLEYRAAGDLFREEGRRRGMDLNAFSRFAELHEEVDRALDATMLALATPSRLLDGRLTGPLCRRNGLSTLYLVVTARDEVRARRLASREGQTVSEATKAMHDREESERVRYLRFYGIDLSREEPDFVVDASDLPPELVSDQLVEFVRSRASGSTP